MMRKVPAIILVIILSSGLVSLPVSAMDAVARTTLAPQLALSSFIGENLWRGSKLMSVSGALSNPATAQQQQEHLSELVSLLSQSQVVDSLVVCGNDDLDLFERLVALLKLDIIQRRVYLTGGYGRLTVPLIKKGVQSGFAIKVAPGVVITRENILEYLSKLQDIHSAHGFVQVSESNIIQQIIEQIIQRDNSLSVEARAELINNFRLMVRREERSMSTYENLLYLKQEHTLTGNVIISQMSYQELRAWATARKVLEQELQSGQLQLLRYTNQFDMSQQDPEWVVRTVLGEIWRLIIYRAKGDIVIDLAADAQEIPAYYWESVNFLFEHSVNQQELREYLHALAANAGHHSRRDLMRKLGNVHEGIGAVISWVYEQPSSRIAVPDMYKRGLIFSPQQLAGEVNRLTAHSI